MAWTLGWGFSTLRQLKSNFNNSVCKDSAATDVLGDLSAWTQTPTPPHPVWAPCPAWWYRGLVPFPREGAEALRGGARRARPLGPTGAEPAPEPGC